ncbi:stereocilin-like [Pristis pectinata]|uniref:stereocilin-like n=1 Tax=Pristis pectinata TaxID=685728 RepID=UPI00223D7B96|nr:stereocilin-like [Pristis pectinata]
MTFPFPLVLTLLLLVTSLSAGNGINQYVELLKDVARLLGEGETDPIPAHAKSGSKDSKRIQSLISSLMGGLRTLSVLPQQNVASFLTKRALGSKQLSAFLYNISLYLQSNNPQDPAAESFILNTLDSEEAENGSPPRATLELRDFFVSLRASQNLDSLIELLQSVLDLVTNRQLLGWIFQKENREVLVGLIETLSQTLFSGTYAQAKASIQELMCSLTSQTDCSVNVDWLESLGKLLNWKNWKSVINFQPNGPPPRNERFRPWNEPRESGSDRNPVNTVETINTVQSLLQILSKPSGRRGGSEGAPLVNQSQNIWGEAALWGGLQELRQNILRKVGTSVYTNFKRKVSRMTGSLVNEVSSVIGIPQSDQNGKCSAGNLRQLLLWGIKNNISWDTPILGFGSRGILETPFLACRRGDQAPRKPRQVSRRSGEVGEGEGGSPSAGSLETVCNDSSPGLPGVSNFTVYLYCNLLNRSSGSSRPPPDLRAACSDAAWYLSVAEEDLYWAQFCRSFYPSEFASSVCSEVSLRSAQDLGRSWVLPLCSGLQRGSRNVNISAGACYSLPGNHPDYLRQCVLPESLRELCSNQTLVQSASGQRVVAELCGQFSGPGLNPASPDHLCSRVKLLEDLGVNKTWVNQVCVWLAAAWPGPRVGGANCERLFGNWSALGSAEECISWYIDHLCSNSTAEGVWVNLFCAHMSRALEKSRDVSRACSRLFEISNVTGRDLQHCIVGNGTAYIRKLCPDGTSRELGDGARSGASSFCRRLRQASRALGAVLAGDQPLVCDYNSWSLDMFLDGDLVERCRDLDAEGFKEAVCRNATVYRWISRDQPWVINDCPTPAVPGRGECFARRLLDLLPAPLSINTSQLCENPAAFLKDLLDQFNRCDDQSLGWISGANYILRVFHHLLGPPGLDHTDEEVQGVLSEAILLSSLLDNSSFWVTFNPNASVSILQTVDTYLKEETDTTLKKDLLNCFSPVLWDLLQNENDSPALRVLFQEYLQMPQENFRKLLMSAESDAVKKLLSYMHRTWRQLQVGIEWVSQRDEPALQTLTASFLHKFPRVTPDLFVDLSQFIPFMTVSDILRFPVSLLLNDSVLAAIQNHSPDMKASQKKAFARRLLLGDTFGQVGSWPPHFLTSVQTLLPYLPTCHFQQLTANQLAGVSDLLRNSSLDLSRGRHVLRTLLNSSQSLTRGQVERLGRLACFAGQADLRVLLAAQPQVSSALLDCIRDGTVDPSSGAAHLLATHLWGRNASTLAHQDLVALGGILPVLGVPLLQNLSAHQRLTVISGLDSASVTAAQADQLVTEIIQDTNVSVDVLCRLGPLLPGFSLSALRLLPSQVLAGACPCFSPYLDHLSSAQKAVVLEALRTVGGEDRRQLSRFGCLIPFVPLKDLVFDPETFLRNRSLFRDWMWSLQQAQFIFKKLQDVSDVTNASLLSLGNVAKGADCKVLRQQATDSEFLAVVVFLSGLHGGIRQPLHRCIIKELSRWPGKFQNNILLMGPEVAADLPLKILNSLPNDSVRTILDHLTRRTLHLLTLLPHKRSYLADRALQLLGVGAEGEISGEVLDRLGPLVAFIEEGKVRQINQADLLLRLDEVKGYCIPEQNRKSFGWMLTKQDVLGDASGWNLQQIEYIDRLVFVLPPEEIHRLPKDVLSPETVELVVRSEGRWERSEVGRACQRQQSRSARTTLLSKKQSLAVNAVKSIVKSRREGSPDCIDIKATFPAAWSSSQLAGMADSEFADCLEVLTSDQDLSVEQLKLLLTKAKHLYGPIRSMKRWQVLRLGRAASQLSDRDLQSLDLLDLGILSFLGEIDEWSVKQRKAGFGSFLSQARWQVTDLDATTLVALGHFICGMSVWEMERIRPEEFSKAVLFIGNLKLRCSESQLEALAKLTTHSEAFGPVSKWGAEIFTEIGSIAAGLADMALSSLVEQQIEGLIPSAISLIPPSKFAVVFSTDQLSYFTSAQASAVTARQYEKLSPEQRRTVSAAQYDGELHQEQRGKNNSPLSASFKLTVLYVCLSVTYSLGTR